MIILSVLTPIDALGFIHSYSLTWILYVKHSKQNAESFSVMSNASNPLFFDPQTFHRCVKCYQ